MACPLHSSQLLASEGHEADGQAITVPTGMEDVDTLCTVIFVGSKEELSAACTGQEKAKSERRKSRESLFMAASLAGEHEGKNWQTARGQMEGEPQGRAATGK